MTLLALMLLSYGAVAAQNGAQELAGVHIYFSEASNEASIFDRSEEGLSRIAGLLQQLGATLFTIDWRFDIPADADLVVIAGPTRDLSPEQMARLWVYLIGGGRLLLIAEPLDVNTSAEGVVSIERNRALQSGRGFFELTWADFGVRGRDDVLIHEDEISNDSATAPTDLLMDFESDVDEASPIQVESDSALAFFGARTIEYDGSIQPYQVTRLVSADPAFYSESAFGDFIETGLLEFNIGSDLQGDDLAVAVAVEHTQYGARIVLIGDRQFVTNGGGLQTSPPNSPNFVYPANVEFVLNSIGWLLGHEAGLSIPLTFSTPAPTPTATEPAPEATESAEATAEPAEATAAPEATESLEAEATEDANTGS
jgi:hypothetical protein